MRPRSSSAISVSVVRVITHVDAARRELVARAACATASVMSFSRISPAAADRAAHSTIWAAVSGVDDDRVTRGASDGWRSAAPSRAACCSRRAASARSTRIGCGRRAGSRVQWRRSQLTNAYGSTAACRVARKHVGYELAAGQQSAAAHVRHDSGTSRCRHARTESRRSSSRRVLAERDCSARRRVIERVRRAPPRAHRRGR